MASASANTFYARPVYLDNERDRFRKATMNDTGQRNSLRQKQSRFSDMDNMSPPPRPPPPRPSRAPNPTENGKPSQRWASKPLENGPLLPRDKKRQLPQTPHDAAPETKPLTHMNVTSHEQLWQKDVDNERDHSRPNGILSPPLKYITPQTTEELFRNFDRLDLIDSMSEHSDSSADTMIMMTTEEEQKNQERIDHSLKNYTSLKTKNECLDSNKSKANIQTKKNLHIHFSDTNGFETESTTVPNGPFREKDDVIYSKVVPLHIRTDQSHSGTTPECAAIKTNSNHGSPNDSPDDGYGTNSSSGTVSSPFSSSFGSNDLENSYNGNCKKVILPNGAIKPNSVRESWAVKRKQRMIESSDNTVQDQLRELTIIEEEGAQRSVKDKDKNSHRLNVVGRRNSKPSDITVLKNENLQNKESETKHDTSVSAELSFVNVSTNDLRRVNRQLYVMDSDKCGNVSTQRRRERILPQTPTTNEINSSAPRVPPHHNSNTSSHSLLRLGNQNSDDVFVSQTGNDNVSSENRGGNNWEEESESSAPDSMNSGPFILRGGAGEQRFRTASGSGKIYVSPSGDEGFYSLNRSSRSTSVSSFQNEVTENVPQLQNGPISPLEVLSGDFLEKWSDMDLNYRNYYGFDEQIEKYSRTDSKVNYFQEKKINTIYGQDNYYRPQNYASEPALAQGQGQGSSQGSTNQGNRRVSKDKNGSASKSSTLTSQKSGKIKDKESGSSKSKFFQILPSMFKTSSKKHTNDSKNNKNKAKTLPITVETSSLNEQKSSSFEHEQEAEYINMSDLPQYSLAGIQYEEKLRKGEYVSMESLRKRPVFASSMDIKKLFSTHDQSFDSINSPGAQRHSFHAMPLSYRHRVSMNQSAGDDMRPRAQSTSATMRSQQIRNSVESHMAVISRKNATVMNQAKRTPNDDMNADENVSVHSNSSVHNVAGSRNRLDSGSSCGDSKLSTLV